VRPSLHHCGACRAKLFTARWETGVITHVERLPQPTGDIVIIPDLPGISAGLPHVARSIGRRTLYRIHACPKLPPAHSAGNFDRKQR
jgi:hypothetical protein